MTSYEREITTYCREPVGVTRNQGAWPEPTYRFSIVACARWESRYVVEWLAYHRSIGIDHIYLYCNDDDPQEMFEQVMPFTTGEKPFVTFHHYSFQGLQFQMYFHFLRHHAHETKWMMYLDLDEFLCVRDSNSIPALMSKFDRSVDAVYFNWCSFGANGHKTRPTGYTLMNYTRRERTVTPFTKVFIRTQSVPYEGFFSWNTAPVMHDYTCLDPTLVVRNVLNDDLSTYYRDFPSQAWPYIRTGDNSERILATAFVAHFNIKSDEDFLLRVKRGLKGDYAAEAMWGEKNEEAIRRHHAETNAVEDTYLRDYWRAYLAAASYTGSVFPECRWPLISENKEADQSSTVHNRSKQEDARAVLSGRLLGRSQNHTEIETSPWWVIDLGKVHRVHELRVFNRLDGVLDRMARFELHSAKADGQWVLRHAKADGKVFGGADGNPYCWTSVDGFPARWLRLSVPGAGRYLHVDQIQFFGTPM